MSQGQVFFLGGGVTGVLPEGRHTDLAGKVSRLKIDSGGPEEQKDSGEGRTALQTG